MWNLLGPILALLPERWRKEWLSDLPVNWPRAGLLSGLLEAFFGLLGLIGWYLYAIQHYVNQQMEATMTATKGVPAEGAAFGMGAAALITFAVHPLTWALVYFSIEGLLRMFAATLAEEVPGTLPLVLIDRLISRGRRARYEARVPLVADAVTPGTDEDPWDLKVESCRPKPTWKYPLTISLKGEYFQVVGESATAGTARPGLPQPPERPHVYLLKRPPKGEAYRGVRAYDPEEVLRVEEKPKHFLAAWFDAREDERRVKKLPLVADTVSRGDGSKGWHLKVESCRPKPMWTPSRTIRFEDVLYRVESLYESKPPRPFGYTLVFLPTNEAARGVIDYSPDEPLFLAEK